MMTPRSVRRPGTTLSSPAVARPKRDLQELAGTGVCNVGVCCGKRHQPQGVNPRAPCRVQRQTPFRRQECISFMCPCPFSWPQTSDAKHPVSPKSHFDAVGAAEGHSSTCVTPTPAMKPRRLVESPNRRRNWGACCSRSDACQATWAMDGV